MGCDKRIGDGAAAPNVAKTECIVTVDEDSRFAGPSRSTREGWNQTHRHADNALPTLGQHSNHDAAKPVVIKAFTVSLQENGVFPKRCSHNFCLLPRAMFGCVALPVCKRREGILHLSTSSIISGHNSRNVQAFAVKDFAVQNFFKVQKQQMSSTPPTIPDMAIVVDLERELLRSDVEPELILAAFKRVPFVALSCLLGMPFPDSPARRARLATLPFDAAGLLYDQDAVAHLRQAQANGVSLSVTSRLPEAWVAAIGQHLGLVWSILPEVTDIDSEKTASSRLSRPGDGPSSTPSPSLWRAVLKVMRLHQWAKNILVFAPLALSHRLSDFDALGRTFLAFICFGLVASSIYVLNDMLDVAQDRKHASKCRRPFASGALPVRSGFVLLPVLLALGIGLGSLLPRLFLLVMAAYLVLNLAYVFFLKRKLLVDVLALAGGYSLRILAGNAAGPVDLSSWLLAFSMFLFLSLALVKRYVELDTTEIDAAASHKVMGRGYRRADLDMLAQLGVSSGFSAVVVMALYVDAAGKQGLYRIPELIWLVCPIILFTISRIWVLAKRREMPDDPVMFIIKDWRSHLMGLFIAIILVLAT